MNTEGKTNLSISDEMILVIRRWYEMFTHVSMKDFKGFMGQASLSRSQAHALMRLHFGGEITISDIGDGLGISSPAASQMIDRLVQMGLVERTENPVDRRLKRLAITAKGEALVLQGLDAQWKWMETLTTSLMPEDQKAILRAFTILTEATKGLMPPEGRLRSHRGLHRPPTSS
jgi:DNA-binding MarR family transcriptional regulator